MFALTNATGCLNSQNALKPLTLCLLASNQRLTSMVALLHEGTFEQHWSQICQSWFEALYTNAF